jgi:hypothetical protein
MQLDLFSPAEVMGDTIPVELKHDWHYLLNALHLLWADTLLSWTTWITGLSLSAGAIGALLNNGCRAGITFTQSTDI